MERKQRAIMWDGIIQTLKSIYLGSDGAEEDDRVDRFVLNTEEKSIDGCLIVPSTSWQGEGTYHVISPIDGEPIVMSGQEQHKWLSTGMIDLSKLTKNGRRKPFRQHFFVETDKGREKVFFDVYSNDRGEEMENLNSGAYGDVFFANDDAGKLYVQKWSKEEKDPNCQALFREAFFYQKVFEPNIPGICDAKLLYMDLTKLAVPADKLTTDRGVLLLPLLGESISSLLDYCEDKFDVPTVARLAVMLIHTLCHIHSKNVVHRDIKPDNVMMGMGDERHVLHLIDFGLAEEYEYGGESTCGRAGTTKYMSIFTHNGCSPRPRDDLQSAAYTMAKSLRGRLPWDNVGGDNSKELTRDMKAKTSDQQLFRGFPEAFKTFYAEVSDLEVDELPDYDRWITLFSELYTTDTEYLWNYKWRSIDQPYVSVLSQLNSVRPSNEMKTMSTNQESNVTRVDKTNESHADDQLISNSCVT